MKLGLIDISIAVIYLVICLIIGLYKYTKIKTPKQFALGYQSLSTTMLICVIFATTVGAGTIFGYTEKLYIYGIAFLVGQLFMPLYWFITAIIYVPNIERFKGCISISQVMHRLYGTPGRWITNFAAIVYSLGVIAAQALAIGYIFHYFLGIEVFYGILISFSILTIYTSLGGIRAVVLTEVFQFSVFFFVIPVSYLIALTDINGMQNLMRTLPVSHWRFELTAENTMLVTSFIFYSLLPSCDSTLIQRCLMASGSKQLGIGLRTIGLIYVPFTLSMCLIAYIVRAQAPNIPAKEAFLFYIDNFLPLGLKGLLIAGIMAAIMSIAEAWLNTTSIILVNDAVKVLIPTINNRSQLLALRAFVVILAIISIIIASFSNDVIGLFFLVANFWSPVILMPLSAGFLGFKTSSKAFVASVVFAIVFTIIGRLIVGEFAIISLGLGIFGSSIGLFGMHYLQVTGKSRKKIKIKKRVLLNTWLFKQISVMKGILTIVADNVFKFINQLQCTISQKEPPYSKFATFTLAYYFAYTFNLTADPAHKTLSYLLVAGYLFCFILLLRDVVFSRNFQKKYLPLYWYCTLVLCLPSVASYMLFAGKGDDFWIINGLLTAFSLYFFVDAITFVILLSIGVVFGYGIFLLSGSKQEILQTYNTLGNIGYVYLFFLFAFLSFFRSREKEQEEKVATMHMLGGAIAHEVKTPISGLVMFVQAMDEILDKAMGTAKSKGRDKRILIMGNDEFNFLMQIKDSLKKIGARGISTVDSILMALKSSVVGDEKKLYRIKKCVEEAIAEYSIFDENVRNIEVNIKNDFKVSCSLHYLKHTLFNLIKNAYRYGGADVKIRIWTKNSTLHFKDYGKGIAKENLSRIFDRFYTRSKTGTGIGLAFCKTVMEDLGGEIKCESEPGKYTEFILVFPKPYK